MSGSKLLNLTLFSHQIYKFMLKRATRATTRHLFQWSDIPQQPPIHYQVVGNLSISHKRLQNVTKSKEGHFPQETKLSLLTSAQCTFPYDENFPIFCPAHVTGFSYTLTWFIRWHIILKAFISPSSLFLYPQSIMGLHSCFRFTML